MSAPLRQAAGLLLVAVLTGALAACGGGFSSAPPPPPDRTISTYVALGDGYTAAPYAGPTASDDGCLRSARNYPALVAEKLGIKDVRDVSCTGATTKAFTEKFKPGKGRKAVAAQLDAISKDTDLVTIGGGIEDGDTLTNMFRVCLVQPCAPGTVFYTQVLDAVNRAADSFTSVLRDIQTKAPDAYVVVVGYPRLTPPPESGCHDFPAQPAQATQDVVNYLVDDLNGKLRSAARQTGSGYVDVSALSDQHVLCSPDPWVHGMTSRPGKAVAYHPVAAEQRAVADAAVTVIDER